MKNFLRHEFPILIGLAGLRAQLSEQKDRDPDFAANWAIVSEWSPDARYDAHDPKSAQTIIAAINDPQSGPTMDQNILVSSGHALVKALDDAGMPPRIAMWVHNTDTDTWKLWIVPPAGFKDKHEFYRRISEIVSKNRAAVGGFDASDTEMVLDTHPAMRGIGRFLGIRGLGSAYFSGNMFNGYYLPDGIILRSDL